MSAAPAPSPTAPIRPPRFPASTGEVPSSAIQWRGLAGDLWVARREGRHLGAVQRGRRWTALDADSAPIGSYRTFAEAQQAVAQPPGAIEQVAAGRSWGPLVFVGVMSASAAMLLGVWPLRMRPGDRFAS